MRRSRYGYHSGPHSNTAELKSRLTEAFKVLRKEGFFARQNFWCCQTCACDDIGTKVEAMNLQQKEKFRGYVFYHKQDNDGLNRSGETYLAFGHSEDEKSAEAGARIAEVLREKGITVDWDGKGTTRILAKLV